MTRTLRIRVALAVLLLGGGAAAWVFLGVRVGGCLGPLGVTSVQCAAATGVYPTLGWEAALFAATVALAIGVLNPGLLQPRVLVAVTALVGGALGASLYVAFRPQRMEGLTSTGAFLSLPLPLDLPAVVAAATAVSTAAVVALWLARRALPVRPTGDRGHAS